MTKEEQTADIKAAQEASESALEDTANGVVMQRNLKRAGFEIPSSSNLGH